MGSAALNCGRILGGVLDAHPAADSETASIARDGSFIFDPEHDVERGPHVPIAGTDGARRPDGRGHQPVSYTHLDVYKRQVNIALRK